ncbi:hypothetical protein GGR50DRAFT_141713 [Xylaria sp. CBS 124048]|nr:hypothetical protein GGR50DRAFT_141713 [Xylaria sp. CBS 124048]
MLLPLLLAQHCVLWKRHALWLLLAHSAVAANQCWWRPSSAYCGFNVRWLTRAPINRKPLVDFLAIYSDNQTVVDPGKQAARALCPVPCALWVVGYELCLVPLSLLSSFYPNRYYSIKVIIRRPAGVGLVCAQSFLCNGSLPTHTRHSHSIAVVLSCARGSSPTWVEENRRAVILSNHAGTLFPI